MNDKTTFCENCSESISFSVNKETIIQSFKGENIEFIETTAVCDKCKNAVFVAEFLDINLLALYDAYRLKQDIISLKHIREIPIKYAIGKRPLSLLLGWGELTFTRYYDGDMPTNQYAAILKRI